MVLQGPQKKWPQGYTCHSVEGRREDGSGAAGAAEEVAAGVHLQYQGRGRRDQLPAQGSTSTQREERGLVAVCTLRQVAFSTA